tara:strand:+ start:839 stop:1417 length:579 start_codon:yes stop_codon:yes gene_type:complete
MNNYQKSLELLRDSDFTVKKLVTFNGHEGRGANADIYWKKRKVATFLDEGNGGEPYVYWTADWDGDIGGDPQEIRDFIASLPHYSLAERYEDDSDFAYDWDETPNAWKAKDVIDALVHVAEERREFKKILRKVCGIKDGDVLTWKQKASDLYKEFVYKGDLMPMCSILRKQGVKCLNSLPETEAFALLRKHG